MSDDVRARALLHGYAAEAPTADVGSALWDRGRARRRKGRYTGVGAVVVATALAVLAYGVVDANITTHSMPVGPADPTPSVTETPVSDLQFPMLPSGVDRGTAVLNGNPQLLFRSWTHDNFSEMAMYPDGLVVWQTGSGYVQLRLTPAGVASIRSTVISTGLFDQEDDGVGLVAAVPDSELTIDRGSGLVNVQWTKTPSRWERGYVQATPSQERDLAAVARLLQDPATWPLSSDMYANPNIKPFWGTGYTWGFDRSSPDLTRLPDPVARRLARLFPRPNRDGCSPPTGIKETRELLDALVQARFKPEGNGSLGVSFYVPGTSGHSFLHVHPSGLPITCGYPE